MVDKLLKVTPKFEKEKLLLSGDKVFYTLQGEGPTIGLPAIFIRTHICNLSCDWSKSGGERCDAWYTWDKDSKEYWTEHSLVSYEELYNSIKQYNCKRLVFTGGEPLLQQDRIGEFLIYLFNREVELLEEWKVEIETNGTIVISTELTLLKHSIQINCSPKLKSAGGKLASRINYKALMLINEWGKSNFKFVVTSTEDLEEIENIVKNVGLEREKIIIMPEGTNTEILTKRMRDLAELVKVKRWRLVPRLQCFIWGNKRGV